jgi:hypothetical protein
MEKKDRTVKQNEAENKEQSEKGQEMSQEEFERLLMKVKFIAFGIMGNIKWDKVKPLEFWKEEDEEFVKLVFEVEKKVCSIEYIIKEEDKQKFIKKTSVLEIVERFITNRLVDYGRNDYFDDKCPECKQTTLTRTSVMNDPKEEGIACVLCDWAGFMITYNEYLKTDPSLEFPEW